MATYTSNGCPKAVRKGYEDLDCKFRTTPRYLATIDFGTTHCSIAFLLHPGLSPNPSKLDPTLVTLDDAGNKRIPNCILFAPNGKIVAIGYEARDQFGFLDSKLRPRYHYFEHVKKSLRHEKNIDRNQKITSLNGQQFFLVDVIAHILHHLKSRLLTELRDFGYGLKASDFDWVITVPAIWKSRGRKMMREAGYMAGLCSDLEPPCLSIAFGFRSPFQEEKSPEKLSLALEPESAAIHCRQTAMEAGRASEFAMNSEIYLVVDVGGGTVDITSHAIVGGRIEEIAPPAGNFWGGTTVNEVFLKFLQDFVDDPKFSRYVESGTLEKKIRHKADLNRILYTRFELLKQQFGSGEAQDNYFVEFPRSFLNLYDDSLIEKARALNLKGDMSVRMEDDGTVMRISNSKMVTFFQPAIDEIVDLIESHLKKYSLAHTIDTIYWVGGFGGCKYLRNQLEVAIKTTFRSFQHHFPPKPELAVILGATAFRCDPGIVTKRRADATYGSDCWIKFDPTVHCPHYKEWDEESSVYRCKNIFRAFVERGEDVCTNQVFVMDYCPAKRDQKSACFPLYSTPRRDVWYTTDDDVYKIGEVSIDIGGYGLDREMELVCDITHTEIQIRARDKTSGNERKVVIDFLSSGM